MKKVRLFEQFINEAVQFGKKGIKAKAQEKVAIAQMAYDKWGDSYLKTLDAMKKLAKDGKLPSYKEHINVQGGDEQDEYQIFIGRNAALLAFQIEKVIKKYKKYEVEKSSTPAAGGWSGTMRSTVGGEIQGRSNFSNGSNRYLIAVTCGKGIDGTVRDKMFQEIYELMFVYDEFNGSDGGVSFHYDSGSNYDTIGLRNSSYQLTDKTAKSIVGIMNESVLNESKLKISDIKYSMELAFDETYNVKALKKISKKGKDIQLNMSSYMSPDTLETYNIIGKFNEIMGTNFQIVPGSFQKGSVTSILLAESAS